MKSLITTAAITIAMSTSVMAVDMKPIQLDAYTIVSTMKQSDQNKFAKFVDNVKGDTTSSYAWKSTDSEYKLGAPMYKVVTGKFYKTQNGNTCSDLVMVLEHGNSIGYGVGTMCKSGKSWVVLE